MAFDNLIALLKGSGTARFYGGQQTAPVRVFDKLSLRRRVTIAEVNAGITLLPGLYGYKYRVSDMRMISIGGAVSGSTTIDITGTQAAAVVKLLAVAIAALTQSALVRAGAANATVLADGVSFADLDTNTGIGISKTGPTAGTATHVDVEIDFELFEG